MARKTKTVTITDDGKNLEFVIEQMPATAGFFFGAKVVRFLCKNDCELDGNKYSIPELFVKSLGGFDLNEFKSVIDDALSSVRYKGGLVDQVCTSDTLDAIITDPANVMLLVQHSLELNLSFITRAIPAAFQEKMRGAVREAGLSSLISKTEEKSSLS